MLRDKERKGAMKPGEYRKVALAFASFFLLLFGYYILRPVRDEMGVQTGVENLQWLFTGTFLFTLLIVPIFGWAVKRIPRAYLLPAVYGFLIANLLGFMLAFSAGITKFSAGAFFIWLSVFNLFVVSLFWSKVSDSFSTGESHRLYGYIAAGGTVGALAGPALTAYLARHVSSAYLLGIAAVALAGSSACMVILGRLHTAGTPTSPGSPDGRPIGGSLWAGIPLTLKNPYLRGIALLIICYSAVSTVLYVEVADMARDLYPDSGERTRFFATLDLSTNSLALAVQVLGTRKIVISKGLRFTLALVPGIVFAGLALTGFLRRFPFLAVVQVIHRAGNYSLMRPGREMIFTTVDPEGRYKAKSFIDTTVYRANDAASSWIVSALRAGGLNAIFFAGLPAAALWFFTGYRLGGRHDGDGRPGER